MISYRSRSAILCCRGTAVDTPICFHAGQGIFRIINQNILCICGGELAVKIGIRCLHRRIAERHRNARKLIRKRGQRKLRIIRTDRKISADIPADLCAGLRELPARLFRIAFRG